MARWLGLDISDSAVRAVVTAKSGLPLGAINQTIRVQTNVEDAPELELPIAGAVVSDISIVGAKTLENEENLVWLEKNNSNFCAKTNDKLLN